MIDYMGDDVAVMQGYGPLASNSHMAEA